MYKIYTSVVLIILTSVIVVVTVMTAQANTNHVKVVLPVSRTPYSINVVVPDIAENGAEVSVAVIMVGLNTKTRYVKNLKIYVCHMQLTPVSEVNFYSPSKLFRQRFKLKKSDNVIAVATLNTGEILITQKRTRVTRGGCGGGPDSGPIKVPYLANADSANSKLGLKSSLANHSVRLVTTGNRSLKMTSMRTDIRINGFRARVLIDMQFYNKWKGLQEGRFQLRLPENATPHYVAFGDVVLYSSKKSTAKRPSATSGFSRSDLAIGKQPDAALLKEGVMVPRAKASSAYNTMVRQRVDPALVEWNGRGVYSVRVFPLQAHSSHRVLIAYDLDLPLNKNMYEYTFKAPEHGVKSDVYIRVDKKTALSLNVITPSPVTAVNGREKVFRLKPQAGEQVRISFTNSRLYYLKGRKRKTGKHFSLRGVPKFPHRILMKSNPNAVIMLDTSAYPGNKNYQHYIKYLVQMLQDNEDSIRRFALLTFDVGTRWWQKEFVPNNALNRKRLLRYLHRIKLSGATDLHRALVQVARPDWAKKTKNWDLFMFTDGYATWGDTRINSMIHVMNTSNIDKVFSYVNRASQNNMTVLNKLVSYHKGAVFPLRARQYKYQYTVLRGDHAYLSSQAFFVTRMHRYYRWRIVAIEGLGVIDAITQNNVSWYTPGESITIVGRGNPVGGELTLKLKDGKKTATVTIRVPVSYIASELTSRLYGEAVVRRLEDDEKSTSNMKTLALINAYASYYRIARRTVSLLMLETRKDYQRFRIVSNTDYSTTIRKNPVSTLVSRIRPQRIVPPVLPVLVNTQMDDLQTMFATSIVCGFPISIYRYIGELTLGKRKSPKREKLEFTIKGITFVPLHYVRSGQVIRQRQLRNILSSVKALSKRGQKKNALRLVSALMDNPKKESNLKLEVARVMNQLGYYNETYFLFLSHFKLDLLTSVPAALLRSVKALQLKNFSRALDILMTATKKNKIKGIR